MREDDVAGLCPGDRKVYLLASQAGLAPLDDAEEGAASSPVGPLV